jgi:Cft2 family RNA processing exonuclease
MKYEHTELGFQEYPLFELSEMTKLSKHFCQMKYGTPRAFHKGDGKIDIELFDAEHVPGASEVILEYKQRRIFFREMRYFASKKLFPGCCGRTK